MTPSPSPEVLSAATEREIYLLAEDAAREIVAPMEGVEMDFRAAVAMAQVEVAGKLMPHFRTVALRAAEVATEREKKRCIVAVEAAHDENDSSPDACFSYHCVSAIEASHDSQGC